MPEAFKNYIRVAKPGIILGNLITAAGGFFLAARGRVDLAVMSATLIGISLVVASGCVFNNWIDRNLDRKMIRTRDRVLARRLMAPKIAVGYALLLGIAGTVLIWVAANLLSLGIALAGFTVYVGLYSLYLKRNSIYSALIGSLAGAAPPLAGYCAAGGRFDTGALILILIFSLWQMPHCYAIAVLRYDDYAAAAIPVLPVKQGMTAARMHIFGYILAFTAAALMLTVAGYTGTIYFAVAAALGFCWLYLAWSGHKTFEERVWAQKLFVFSVLTIFILSFMMSIDTTRPDAAIGMLTYMP
jgi:protoheme IX farnesyltransferase